MPRLCSDDGLLGVMTDYKLDALIFPNDYNRPSTFATRGGLPVMALPPGFFGEETATKRTKTVHQIDIAPSIP